MPNCKSMSAIVPNEEWVESDDFRIYIKGPHGQLNIENGNYIIDGDVGPDTMIQVTKNNIKKTIREYLSNLFHPSIPKLIIKGDIHGSVMIHAPDLKIVVNRIVGFEVTIDCNNLKLNVADFVIKPQI